MPLTLSVSCRVFGVVSYYVQKLFAQYQGVRYIETAVAAADGDSHDHGIAASASCQDGACTKVAFKVTSVSDVPAPALTLHVAAHIQPAAAKS